MQYISAGQPVFKYQGGKKNLAKQIVKMIPEHIIYVEVCTGSGRVFFKKEKSKVEVINDINNDIFNLYNILKHHPEELCNMLRYSLMSRSEFEQMNKANPNTMTDIQRAARFLYVQNISFGGKVIDRSFGITKTKDQAYKPSKLIQLLKNAHNRLEGVLIENQSLKKIIPKFDTPDTFFYIDPPYWGYENAYGKGIFERNDFYLLNELLSSIKGKFLLSLNDIPEIREIYKNFNIKEVETTYSFNKIKNVKELLISNY